MGDIRRVRKQIEKMGMDPDLIKAAADHFGYLGASKDIQFPPRSQSETNLVTQDLKRQVVRARESIAGMLANKDDMEIVVMERPELDLGKLAQLPGDINKLVTDYESAIKQSRYNRQAEYSKLFVPLPEKAAILAQRATEAYTALSELGGDERALTSFSKGVSTLRNLSETLSKISESMRAQQTAVSAPSR